MTIKLEPIQRLATSGARAVEPFEIDGVLYLAAAQLALDIPGQPASMNAGSSDTMMPIYRWQQDGFVPHAALPVPGGEDAEFFRIGDRMFLATASLRTGDGPYVFDAQSVVYEWREARFEPFQSFPTFAAKQWRHFAIDGRHFLALAQGVVMDGVVAAHPAQSCIFEWDGTCFVAFQTVASAWGYNWRPVALAGRHLLAYADHAAPSRLLAWSGQRFEEFQPLDGRGGRAFCFFASGDESWMAVANLLEDSALYRWTGTRFERHQTLCGPGARELLWLGDGQGHLVQANFLLGSREAPRVMTESVVYGFRGGRLEPVATFESSGAVDVAAFSATGAPHIVVANSLGPDLRFRTDSVVFRIQETVDATAAQQP